MGEGGLQRRAMYFSTVDFGRSMPIFCSSPTILGDPQSGLAEDMRRIRLRTSPGIGGRPGFPERLSPVQYFRNLRRRQAITVSGWAITRASRQPDHIRDSQDQKSRSLERMRGRRRPRRSTFN